MNRTWWLLLGAICVTALSFPLLFTDKPPSAEQKVDQHHDEIVVNLNQQQIDAGNFSVREVGSGVLIKRLSVPGSIVPAGDRIAKVSVRLLGTVAELRKQLGDPVEPGDVLAIIESREVADAKSEYLASRLTFDLQQTLFNRSKTLFEGKVISENDFLRARTTFLDGQNKFEIARQKLFAIGLTDEQITALPNQPVATLRRQELRAPIAGRVAERRVDLGSLVGREGQESELFVILDSSVVWADLAVASTDLASVSEGQQITLISGTNPPIPARIMFISPILDKDTRFARVIASVENPDGSLRPGGFVTAEITHRPVTVDAAIPKTAVQTVTGESVVFVRNAEGFERRRITIGQDDGRSVEVTHGLAVGERIATANTFILKAELGKGEAEHAD